MTEVCNARIGNKKRLQTDLIKGVCRVRAFIPGCNIVRIRPGRSSFFAKPLISLQVRK